MCKAAVYHHHEALVACSVRVSLDSRGYDMDSAKNRRLRLCILLPFLSWEAYVVDATHIHSYNSCLFARCSILLRSTPTCPSRVRKMLAGLRSRCMIRFPCM